MTIEILETYRGLKAEAEAIEAQIKEIEKPLKSIGSVAGTVKVVSKLPSNPTERNALRIIELDSKVKIIRERMKEIEDWIDSIDDGELRAIMRWHFINGLNWNDTNFRVLGYYSYFTSRKKVERFFEN